MAARKEIKEEKTDFKYTLNKENICLRRHLAVVKA